MLKYQRILSLLAGVSACIHILSEYFGPQIMIFIFKPLTMLFIIAMAVIGMGGIRSFYASMVLTGLIFSLAGDIFLMFPSNMFIYGLAAFLAGHIFYILAFVKGIRPRMNSLSWLPFIVYGVLIYGFMLPSLQEMAVPVLIYVIVILTMGWRAYERWAQIRTGESRLAFIGALLFIISDSALGISRFSLPFELSTLIVLIFYFPAQWFIALSIRSK